MPGEWRWVTSPCFHTAPVRRALRLGQVDLVNVGRDEVHLVPPAVVGSRSDPILVSFWHWFPFHRGLFSGSLGSVRYAMPLGHSFFREAPGNT